MKIQTNSPCEHLASLFHCDLIDGWMCREGKRVALCRFVQPTNGRLLVPAEEFLDRTPFTTTQKTIYVFPGPAYWVNNGKHVTLDEGLSLEHTRINEKDWEWSVHIPESAVQYIKEAKKKENNASAACGKF